VRVAATLLASPGLSLPQATEDWSDLKAAYRFLSNPRVMPDDIQAPQRNFVLRRCAAAPVVLCVEDGTDFSFTNRTHMGGLGTIGDGGARGFDMHSALAVTPQGEMLGVLDQRFIAREYLGSRHERRADRQVRWRESQLWIEALKRIGDFPVECRVVMVADRGADDLETFHACIERRIGFVIRAKHDRNVQDESGKLWEWAQGLPVADTRTIEIGRNASRSSTYVRKARKAEVSVRFGSIELKATQRCSRPPIRVGVVYVREDKPPSGEGIEPVDWLLLCDQPLNTLAEAQERILWYSNRWIIEEWHRALKEGCRIEAFQLDQAIDMQRLAVILGPVAAWLLQLRNLARNSLEPKRAQNPEGTSSPCVQSPEKLRECVTPEWIQVVATMTRQDPATMTPSDFWLAVARRGGYTGRNKDGPPGWKTIWRGWYEFQQMVDYLRASSCG
jgi:hypothetical protein